MMVLIKIYIPIAISCKEKPSICKFHSVETLFTEVGSGSGTGVGYSHTLVATEYSRDCLDSNQTMRILNAYMDTVSSGKPIDMIHLYNSSAQFIEGETAQIWEDVNKDCLVVVWIDPKTNRPEQFTFYDEDGLKLYEGKKWLPDSLREKL